MCERKGLQQKLGCIAKSFTIRWGSQKFLEFKCGLSIFLLKCLGDYGKSSWKKHPEKWCTRNWILHMVIHLTFTVIARTRSLRLLFATKIKNETKREKICRRGRNPHNTTGSSRPDDKRWLQEMFPRMGETMGQVYCITRRVLWRGLKEKCCKFYNTSFFFFKTTTNYGNYRGTSRRWRKVRVPGSMSSDWGG